MVLEASDYREILSGELSRRCSVNSRYSLRAFSTKLGVTPSLISEVLNGKRGLSATKAKEIASRLQMNSIEQDYFVALVEKEHSRSSRSRAHAQLRLKKFQELREKPVHLDSWKIISEWYHVAILELSRLEHFDSDHRWIAKQLGITTKEARHAISRLMRLGILKRSEEGKLVPTGSWLLMSPQEIPSECIRKFHAQILAKATKAIGTQSIEKRNYSSLVFAIEEADIPKAKELIVEFNKKLSKLLTAREKRNKLYCFSTQLFALEEER